ncbi:hypothetical protein [Flavobacterium sp.]|uniref:hypothetical protein n=1 Tax=Flavobacterium sp. TaxID=239 RepID=UPI002FDA8673
MKKLFFLFAVSTILFSCSNDNSNTAATDSIKKVIFYRNSPDARQWNFSNDLLTSITLLDGTLVEAFTYDIQKRLVKDVKYTNGVATETNDIVYNTNNTIKSINGLEYTYEAATQTYAYSYSGTFSMTCQVNSDQLALNYSRTGTDAKEYHFAYTNGNMTSFEKVTNGTTEVLKNFHFESTLYGNPIASAVLPVARVKSLLDPDFFIDGQASKSIPVGFDRGASDPYYYNYGMVIGENKYFSVGIEVLDNNNDVDFIQFAEYYYQAQ